MNSSVLRQIVLWNWSTLSHTERHFHRTKKTYTIRIITSLLALFISLPTTIVFAENTQETPACDACTTTSPFIDNYIDFGYEIIRTLRTYANKEASILTSEKNSTWNANNEAVYTDNIQRQDIRNALDTIASNLNSKAQSLSTAWLAATLITIEWAALDSWKSLWPMLHSASIMRDRQKLDALDQQITNTIFELGNAGVFIRLGFKPGLEDRLISIAQSYSQWSYPVLGPVGVYAGWNPSEWISALRRMNQSLKTIIGTANRSQINNNRLNGQLTFSQALQDELVWSANKEWYYTCAKWAAGLTTCSRTKQSAKNAAQNIIDDTKNQGKEAIDIIKKAAKRLSWFRSKNGDVRDSLKERENELLRSQYWLMGPRNNIGIVNATKQTFSDARKSVRSDITQTAPIADIISPDTYSQKEEPFVVGDLASIYKQGSQQNTFQTIMQSTISQARQSQKATVFWEIAHITKLFPDLTKSIITSTYTIDSAKPQTIVKNLWKACELQCSNLGGTCRYDQ